MMAITFLIGAFFIIFIKGSSAVTDCGLPQFLTAPTGTIRSHVGIDFGHNYGKNMICTWHIQAPVGHYVELVAEIFDIYGTAGSYCSYDYLTLYDGPYTNATSLGRFCGNSFLPISSTQRYLTLEFRTNSYTQQTGFKLHYNFTQHIVHSCRSGYWRCANDYRCIQNSYRCDGDDDCGDDSDERNCPPWTCSGNNFPCRKERKCISTSWLCDGGKDCQDGSDEVKASCTGGAWKCGPLSYSGASGSIQTPGYPISTYPVSMTCRYDIQAPNNTDNITITFESNFSIETDVNCQYDYVKIYTDGGRELHGPYCGTRTPPSFTIDSDHVIVEFNSDNSDTYAGFKLNWLAS